MIVYTFSIQQGILKYAIVVLAETREHAEKFLREIGVQETFIKSAKVGEQKVAPGVIYTS